jgi:hypothetical protein
MEEIGMIIDERRVSPRPDFISDLVNARDAGDKLGDLVFDRLATMQPTVTHVGGREKIVVWMNITAAGRKVIAD